MQHLARYARSALAAAAVIVMVAGCSSVKLDEQQPAPITEAGKSGAGDAGDARAVKPVTTASTTGVDPFTDPNNPLSKKSVYFDFDSFVVKSEFQPLVEAHGKYLAANSGRQIKIEGNTDERGGREYNLALGQKRAEAVKQRLLLMGARDAQIETVSFGKEKPRALGSTEEAWAQNRRADIVYK
ncbi:MAG TPA: peptidoglycan-associated lipoprotein Pal [Burkholderiaceae bacterium]|nr:peptidoglycan-associated lipoprotein Pal [Burkholderiaceae bacterium]HQR72751.1 peptidoglycan-associated lipoprotein Pal [Burkholderiaceae bacterium]